MKKNNNNISTHRPHKSSVELAPVPYPAPSSGQEEDPCGPMVVALYISVISALRHLVLGGYPPRDKAATLEPVPSR